MNDHQFSETLSDSKTDREIEERACGSLQRMVGRRRSKRESLQWATEQLEQMAKEETDPKLRALWLHSAARGYELGAKPANIVVGDSPKI